MASLKNIIQDKNGKVGIGTYTPGANLQVGSPGADLTQDLLLVKGGGSSGNFGFRVQANNSEELFFVDTLSYNVLVRSGNVGIGTASPVSPLDVAANAGGNSIALRMRPTSNDYSFIQGRSNDGTEVVGEIAFNRTAVGTGNMLFHTGNGTNSVERMRIDAVGNVGIGTTSPVHKLSVIGNIYQRTGDFITWNNGDAQIGAVSGYNLAFSTYNGSSAMVERMRITSGGNVGIGTTNPSEKLDVNGDIAVKGNSIINRNSNFLTIGDIGNLDNIGFMTLSTADDSTVVHLDDSGNVGIGTTSPGAALDVRGTVMSYESAGNYGKINNGSFEALGVHSGTFMLDLNNTGTADLVNIKTSGSSRFYIKNNGYVGIGTTSPNFHLDVNGSIQSRNQMRAAIYYDYTNTAYYTRPASSDYSGQLKGTLNSENGFSAAIGAVNSTDGVRLTSPGGGSFNSNGNSTGAIKISLPLYQSNKMVNITVEVYDYSNYESFTLKCGGYAAANWANVYAYIMSGAILDRNLPVRFGHDGVKNCIWIGNTNQTWSFLNVYITDVQVGYQTVSVFQWSKNWNISLVTSYDTIQAQIFETQMNNWRKLNNNLFLGSQSTRVGIGNTSPGCRLNTNQNIINNMLIRGTNPSGQPVGVDGTANLGATHMSTFMGSSTTAGLVLANNINTVDAPSPLIAFSARVSSNNYNTTYAAIYGVNKGQTTAGTIWNKGCIVLATADTDKVVERMRIDQDGNVGIGIDSPNSTVDINGTAMQQLRLRNPGGPSATTDLNGREGDFAYDDLYLYVKTGGGWGRVALDFAF